MPSRAGKIALGLGIIIALAVGAGWYVGRVPVPDPPAPQFTANADANLVSDLAAARQLVLDRPRDADTWGEYAILLRAYEQYADADTCFRIAADLNRRDGRWPYLVGDRLADTDPAAAVEWLQKAVKGKLPPEAVEPAWLKLVETLVAADRFAEARTQLEAAPKDARESNRGRLIAARLAVAEGNDRRAAEILSELATVLPARQVFALQAEVYQGQNRPAFAAEVSKKAAAAPNILWPSPLADSILSRNRTRSGRLDEAARLIRAGQPLEAEKVLRPLIANTPDAKPFLGLAEIRRAVGDRLGAKRELEAGANVDPTDANIQYQLGSLAFDTGEQLWLAGHHDAARTAFREAVPHFDAALQTNPTHGKALLLKGVALARFLNQRDEGLKLIRRFIELRPEVSDGHLILGQALAATGDTAAAREAFQRAIALAAPGDQRAAEALANLNQTVPGR